MKHIPMAIKESALVNESQRTLGTPDGNVPEGGTDGPASVTSESQDAMTQLLTLFLTITAAIGSLAAITAGDK